MGASFIKQKAMKTCLVLAIFCFLITFKTFAANDISMENEAVKELSKLGGDNIILTNKANKVIGFHLTEKNISREVLSRISNIRGSWELSIRDPIKDEELLAKYLEGMDNISDLKLLCFRNLNPALTRSISKMRGLKKITLTYNSLSRSDIRSFANSASIEALVMVAPEYIPPNLFDLLSRINSLKVVEIYGGEIPLSAWKSFATYPKLTNVLVRSDSFEMSWKRFAKDSNTPRQ